MCGGIAKVCTKGCVVDNRRVSKVIDKVCRKHQSCRFKRGYSSLGKRKRKRQGAPTGLVNSAFVWDGAFSGDVEDARLRLECGAGERFGGVVFVDELHHGDVAEEARYEWHGEEAADAVAQCGPDDVCET